MRTKRSDTASATFFYTEIKATAVVKALGKQPVKLTKKLYLLHGLVHRTLATEITDFRNA